MEEVPRAPRSGTAGGEYLTEDKDRIRMAKMSQVNRTEIKREEENNQRQR